MTAEQFIEMARLYIAAKPDHKSPAYDVFKTPQGAERLAHLQDVRNRYATDYADWLSGINAVRNMAHLRGLCNEWAGYDEVMAMVDAIDPEA